MSHPNQYLHDHFAVVTAAAVILCVMVLIHEGGILHTGVDEHHSEGSMHSFHHFVHLFQVWPSVCAYG